VKLENEDIADPAAITAEAARADYEARKDRYTTPEIRTIDQLVFADRAAADAAAAELADGKSFDELVTEQGRTCQRCADRKLCQKLGAGPVPG
jgi:peptidyl-prolyl cis-trans isomerase D